ncbi:carbohydrate ABC transporter permease [Vallicoccus soli]|uniref:Carbohydrate ABC transporter permease n=1 Tax=Vallicoccus soli TaxID=2339232 RepID=A0A3A3ZIU5_9ACTN|nr:carbohydrate ABC transporter permease [Vallicoccus soli]RJK95466.1 carbohydrate ABC transporter permease [Vallicoccus soli]
MSTAVRTTSRTPAAAAGRPRPRPSRRRGWRALGYAALVAVAFLYLYPFLVQLVTSVKTDADATQDPLALVPDPLTWGAFERLAQTDFPLWFTNSVVVTLVVTAGRVLFCSLAGYALSRIDFSGRAGLFGLVLAIMAVPPVVLLIPKFLVLNQLQLYDTYAALMVPLMADGAGIFIMKQFFDRIPVSIEEAARIDGAGTLRTFWSVVLPMARPAVITLTILAFQASWNELPHYIVASQDPDLYTLTKGVASLTSGQLGSGNQFPLTMAAALLMTIPVAVVFVVFQRFFVTGANEGGVKG